MTENGKLGWGVIGAAGIARRRTIPEGIMQAPNAQLVAVTDINLEGAKAVAEQFDAKYCGSVRKLLNTPGVDAVYIASPNQLHLQHVRACAKAGKHILCEKPLGRTTSEIRRMIAICKEAGVLLGTGFMMRYNVYHQQLKQMIAAGGLGKPVMTRGQMTCWYPPIEGAWRQDLKVGGGGALVDMGSHVLDVMEMLFGRTKSVFCRTANRVHPYTAEDTAVAIFEFESGMIGTVDVSFAIPDEASEFVFEIYGSQGAVKAKYSLAQGPGGEFRLFSQSAGKGYDAQQNVQEKGGYQPWTLETVNTYKGEVEAFSAAALAGKPAPVSGEDGLWNHAVMEAAYRSARTGKAVTPKI